MSQVERDLFKLLILGVTGAVLIKLAGNSGGVARIIESLGGTYNNTLGTLVKA